MTQRTVKKTGKTGLAALAVVAILALAWTAPAGATVQIAAGSTSDLIAGQYIDVGDLDVAVDGDNIKVTYSATGNWELSEAHLWVGTDILDMPQTKNGNPKIGKFPYAKEDINGPSYSFTIPIESVEALLCDSDGTLFAAHAVVRQKDSRGKYQTETAWGTGDGLFEGERWGSYFSVQFVCGDDDPYVPVTCTDFDSDKLLVGAVTQCHDAIDNVWKLEVTLDYSGNFDHIGIKLSDPDDDALFFTTYEENDWVLRNEVQEKTWTANGPVTATFFYDQDTVGKSFEINVWGQEDDVRGCKSVMVTAPD